MSDQSLKISFISRTLSGATLSWIAIIAGAVTLLANVKSLLDLSPVVNVLVDAWSKFLLFVWQALGDTVGLTVAYSDATLLTIALLLTLAAISARVQRPDLGVHIFEILFRFALFLILFIVLFVSVSNLDPNIDPFFVSGTSLIAIVAAPIFVFSIREGHHWITSLIIAILLIVLLGLIYSLALYDARADSNFFAPENWAIFLAMLSPIIPICISRTNLLLTRLLLLVIITAVLFLFSEFMQIL